MPDIVCLSAGVDWLVRYVVDSESYPGNKRFRDETGVFFVQGDEVVMRFTPMPGESSIDPEIVSLKTTDKVAIHEHAVPFPHWRIWMSYDSFARGDEPLLTR